MPLPYRPNVGIALFDARGRVLIARRLDDDGPEVIGPGFEWQMPQGGIDADEDAEAAAFRELEEETGVTSARLIGAHPDWLTYEFPPYSGPPHKLGAFRGQRQRWFAMRFEGEEAEIDVTRATESAPQEFSEWRWERLETAIDLVVPFKREVYRSVARVFAGLAGA
ncbi:RNA pyrophosphohydrolase [Chenggangzhangella methanolivorans]|uniref:RNA pyrophosphohydrolase n=1 Tax=Chenggangzhangella methanolivorans TaxID=1437009 RepID=A0A9E6RDP9_9HYPH|nr:RNA pyrophosphohydrolase [Chenggangzhangella methanolivorans]QZO01449.1 RNA pyrophosphohydrolase [Chenggangzhangella methanolivorans]